jgi:hypothetical protein
LILREIAAISAGPLVPGFRSGNAQARYIHSIRATSSSQSASGYWSASTAAFSGKGHCARPKPARHLWRYYLHAPPGKLPLG